MTRLTSLSERLERPSRLSLTLQDYRFYPSFLQSCNSAILQCSSDVLRRSMIRVSSLRFRILTLHIALAAAVAAAACGDDTIHADGADPVSVTEAFAGTLTPNARKATPFDSQRGTVTATLLTIDPNPDSTATVGFSLGTWNGVSCAVGVGQRQGARGDDDHRHRERDRHLVRENVRRRHHCRGRSAMRSASFTSSRPAFDGRASPARLRRCGLAAGRFSAGFFAASSFLTASSVRSRPGSAQIRPASAR